MAPGPSLTAAWKVHDCTVLGDNPLDEMEIPGNATKLAENAAGHEQDHDAAATGGSNAVQHGRIQPVVARDRPVVVQRQNREFHWGTYPGFVDAGSSAPSTLSIPPPADRCVPECRRAQPTCD